VNEAPFPAAKDCVLALSNLCSGRVIFGAARQTSSKTAAVGIVGKIIMAQTSPPLGAVERAKVMVATLGQNRSVRRSLRPRHILHVFLDEGVESPSAPAKVQRVASSA
jgi:hypothetical protein